MIKAIGHVAFNAYDFEATLDFYTRVMGFSQMFELQNDAGELWIVYLRISDSVFLELFPQKGPAPTEKDRHFSHLCLEVSGIETVVEELRKRGAPIDVEPQTGKDGNRQAWTRDPEGNRIELMEISPSCLQKQAIARLKEALR